MLPLLSATGGAADAGARADAGIPRDAPDGGDGDAAPAEPIVPGSDAAQPDPDGGDALP